MPAAVVALLVVSVSAHAGLVYGDRTSFLAALAGRGLVASSENYESYALQNLSTGQQLGAFTYNFNPSVNGAAVVSDGAGGQALGGVPSDVFVGGDSVSLGFGGAGGLVAFGADYIYAPSFESVPVATYDLAINDGTSLGTVAGNGAGLDPTGGSFFLGFIGGASEAFTSLSLYSIAQNDASGNPFLVPAYQIDNLVFAAAQQAPVPEPSSLALTLLGLFGLFAARYFRCSETR